MEVERCEEKESPAFRGHSDDCLRLGGQPPGRTARFRARRDGVDRQPHFLCYEDGLTSTGQIVPQNPACQAAVAQSGTTPLYNWFAVGNRTANGGTTGVIPDGKLCSGNSNYYDFSGFDQARSDWPMTHVTAGSTVQIKYNKWAAHPGTFNLYITKDGWDPTKPLTWADLEPTPFATVTNPPSVGDPGSVSSYYYWNATLPQQTGYHIIFSQWVRSDSTENFLGCSDVMFDGGNGNVTGIGAGGSPPPTRRRAPRPTRHQFLARWIPGAGHGDEPDHGHHVRLDGELGDARRRDRHQFLERRAVASRLAGHGHRRRTGTVNWRRARAPRSGSPPTIPARPGAHQHFLSEPVSSAGAAPGRVPTRDAKGFADVLFARRGAPARRHGCYAGCSGATSGMDGMPGMAACPA